MKSASKTQNLKLTSETKKTDWIRSFQPKTSCPTLHVSDRKNLMFCLITGSEEDLKHAGEALTALLPSGGGGAC